MRTVLTHLVCVAVGVGIGSLVHLYAANIFTAGDSPSGESIDKLFTEQNQSQSMPNLATKTNPGKAPEPIPQLLSEDITGSKAVISAHAEDAVDRTSSAAASTLEGLLSGTNMNAFETGELNTVIDNFDTWLEQSQSPAKAIFEFLSSGTDDQEKAVLEWLVARDGAVSRNGILADSIVHELAEANDADYDQWAFVLGISNINTTSARKALFGVLPGIDDEDVVAASLTAIQPALLPPDERVHVLSELAVYAESNSETIKSAALMTLGNWSANDYIHIVEESLINGSEHEKVSALYAVADGTLRSDDIRYQLFSMLNDESESIDLRLHAYASLSHFSLDAQEYAQFYAFYESYVLPKEQLISAQ